MDDVAQPVRIVTLTQRELEGIIARAVSSALSTFQRARATPAQMLSPRQVARMAKIRDERVYEAITAERLKAVRDDTGRFHVALADAEAWIASLVKYRG